MGTQGGPGPGSTRPLTEGSGNLMGCLMHTGKHPSRGQGFSTRVFGDIMQETEKIESDSMALIHLSFPRSHHATAYQAFADLSQRQGRQFLHSKVDGSVHKCPHGAQPTLAKPQMAGADGRQSSETADIIFTG